MANFCCISFNMNKHNIVFPCCCCEEGLHFGNFCPINIFVNYLGWNLQLEKRTIQVIKTAGSWKRLHAHTKNLDYTLLKDQSLALVRTKDHPKIRKVQFICIGILTFPIRCISFKIQLSIFWKQIIGLNFHGCCLEEFFMVLNAFMFHIHPCVNRKTYETLN